ncbi:Flagellar hook-associated protein 1 [Candidatus Methylobacter favarea]|uniref:Flagellar hook-associated protein 1 n=1 Tax=Candidatus Methylobacter favarea TaxID=2707345 RepID=A0A8S0X9U9_9GAMM|nr:flagellar hook-associated protein FlgK [Candidatus Methylobacter favarea]CAA9892696.1 Flagellar hook-associated protein 1 [Candidatus Methylobacter favarea]
MVGILATSLSGLTAAQHALETTSHNIANVNTEGYSRQRVELGTRPAEFTGAGYIGQGVNVNTVARSYDRFITNQLTSSTSAFSESDAFHALASRVDNIVSNEATGLSPALKSFFNSVNEVANDPSSIPARQVLVSEAESVTQQFTTLSSQFRDLRHQTNNQLQGTVNDINSFAQSIASLNAKIVLDSNRASHEQLPNDLLDQRDALVAKLAEKVSVSTVAQQDGSLTVFIGSGQSLVLGATTATVSLTESSTDPSHKNILVAGQDISRNITGGELAGALKFRDEVLDPAQQQLGLLSAGFAVEFNKLHETGFDLNGAAGKKLFGFGTPALTVPITPDPTNSTGSSVTAVYDPGTASQLYPSDYMLSYDGSNYSLKRLSDNTTSTFAGPAATINGPGFILSTSGVSANDSFLIRPTFDAAQKITSLITDPDEIAAAGTGAPGAPVPGDNAVALSLAGLENAPVLLGGKATFSDAYGQLAAKVGTVTHAADISRSAQEALFNQAKQSRENLAGVNLDEEAANLIKFQNSYQASAKAIAVASSLFDTLIGAIRG